MHDSEALVREVLAAGARGFLLKSDAGKALVVAVEALSNHKPFFSSKISELVASGYLNPEQAQKNNDPGSVGLTPREREIVQLCGRQIQQRSGRHVEDQCENRRDPPDQRHAQTANPFGQRTGPLRDSKQDLGSVRAKNGSWSAYHLNPADEKGEVIIRHHPILIRVRFNRLLT